jgi:hypothetical protein
VQRSIGNARLWGGKPTLPICVNIAIGATMFKSMRKSGSLWALSLILCALFVRMIIPAGWMPAGDGADYTRISLCTGMGAQDAWLDTSGGLHKSDPGKKHQGDSPCVFSGLSSALDVPQSVPPAPLIATAHVDTLHLQDTVSIGSGLAAPPPPSTGPPVLI